MPSPRNVHTSLPVIFDKPSRNEMTYANSKHGHRKGNRTSGMSDLSEIGNVFNNDVSTIKAEHLPSMPVSADEVNLMKLGRPRTCMPAIAPHCGHALSKKMANLGHTETARQEASIGVHVDKSPFYRETINIPQCGQTNEACLLRKRRLQKTGHEKTTLQEAYTEITVTRRSAPFSERTNHDNTHKTSKPKTKKYSKLTRDALSSDFVTPLPHQSRIYNWLVDCKEKSDTNTVPTHLPDISLTSKHSTF